MKSQFTLIGIDGTDRGQISLTPVEAAQLRRVLNLLDSNILGSEKHGVKFTIEPIEPATSAVEAMVDAGLDESKAREIAAAVEREVPVAKDAASHESLYRPHNKLADLAIRLGCPHDVAMHVALCYV